MKGFKLKEDTGFGIKIHERVIDGFSVLAISPLWGESGMYNVVVSEDGEVWDAAGVLIGKNKSEEWIQELVKLLEDGNV